MVVYFFAISWFICYLQKPIRCTFGLCFQDYRKENIQIKPTQQQTYFLLNFIKGICLKFLYLFVKVSIKVIVRKFRKIITLFKYTHTHTQNPPHTHTYSYTHKNTYTHTHIHGKCLSNQV